ncbi:MAG TPA: MFS transporter [Gemmatimonadaceae bacterium]|nr:MFS transporter [Gemmatimonadaceae bacterium]
MTTVPITPDDVITQEFRSPLAVRRGVIAGVVGNMLEWYDFALFGFFARQIGAHFFPAGDPTVSLLAAFGTFAAGFLMRPVGGAIFGWVGDRYGRKPALIGSVLAMAIPSFLIGVLPDAVAIGLAAPFLLVLLRLLQGIAVGGEYMASAVFLVEGAEPGRRGWMGSWGPFGAVAGTLLGSAAGAIVNAALPPDAVMAYGWRIPFIVGLAVGLGGLGIRRHYVERVPHQTPAKSPLGEAFKSHWRTILHLMALTVATAVGFYTIFVYSATWLQQQRNVPAKLALEINTVSLAVLLTVTPFVGALSDRIGRRTVLLCGAGGLAVFSLPLLALMSVATPTAITAGQVGLALLFGFLGPALPATMAELAPWRVRCSVLSVGYNITLGVVGGTTPVVAAWLVARTGYILAPGVYMTIAAAITAAAVFLLPRVAPHRMTEEFRTVRFR